MGWVAALYVIVLAAAITAFSIVVSHDNDFEVHCNAAHGVVVVDKCVKGIEEVKLP